MANLHITEHNYLANDPTGARPQIPCMPPVAEQTPLAITGTAAASAEFGASTRFACFTPRADCHIKVGRTPVATRDNRFLTAGQDYYFGVTPGDKVSVISAV